MPNPLEALKMLFSQSPQETGGMAMDMVKPYWDQYQNALPEWATETYHALPEAEVPFGDAPVLPGGFSPQQGYDFARDVLAINPSIDGPLALAGLVGKGVSAGGRMLRGADDVGSYMGRVKPAGGGGGAALSDNTMVRPQPPVPVRPDPRGGFGDNAAGSIRGDLPPQPRFADDFRAMDQQPPLGLQAGEAMQSGPGHPYQRQMDDLDSWTGRITGGNEQLDDQIMRTYSDMISMGADPEEAMEAAILQYSDLLTSNQRPVGPR